MDSTLRETVLRSQHVVQIVLSLYGAAASFVAITNLQKYEAAAKKLAEWSKQAETELSKTRFTQGSGAVAIIASLVASSVLTISPYGIHRWVRIAISPAMLIGVLGARTYLKSYWAPKDGKNSTRVPLPKMGDYNEAERRTENLLQILEYLEYSWGLTSLVHGMIGR
ncbi:hypothetical protein M409DRAFT_30089 [Zasmidium cellare ATCC 36951]|uniref:Uncharacterized protein n=1 Tax=Zasmidium cellare ATCC 36951 TaxID=1080233 RepID=A0A6A6BZN5_ZASCE|nr:uncharacterized protein M409DRAFT_30089 [Zasmidium cellare ATCC 36951]KAF2159468.1 hypothetical protein M409DRAFT_30089 [Zasmidium cellare ATCC 36951]